MMNELQVITPEMTLAGLGCLVLLVDVFKREESNLTFWTASLSLVVVCLLVVFWRPDQPVYAFGSTFKLDQVSSLLKIFILITGLGAFFYANYYFEKFNLKQSEFYSLAIFSILGMLVLASAHSLLTVYLGLELLSLSLYAMVAMDRDSKFAAEAAMKYFVLGALASGILLYGISMLYGATGTLDLIELKTLGMVKHSDLLLVFGLVFVLVGIGFKLGVVPFHMWIPDVYEGSKTPVTLFLSSAPKIAAYAMALRVLGEGLVSLSADWLQMLTFMAVLSMGVGNIAAIAQSSFKRMLAYSTIAHMGFLLLGFIATSPGGYAASMFYVVVYSIMGMGAFAALLLVVSPNNLDETITRFKGLSLTNPAASFMFLILMLSLAGIPPFAGFWAKWFVLKELVASGMLWLAVIAVIFSLIGAYYYLRIIKYMYFDSDDVANSPIFWNRSVGTVFTVNAVAILFLGFFPGILMSECLKAVLSSVV